MNATYSKIIGAVVAIVGIWGYFQPLVLGFFNTNYYSDIIHLLGGAIVFWKSGKQTNMVLGWIALVVGVIGFVPYLSAITDFLGFNQAFHILHIVIGVVSLAVAYMSK